MGVALDERVDRELELMALDVKCVLGDAMAEHDRYWTMPLRTTEDFVPARIPLDVRGYRKDTDISHYVHFVRDEAQKRLSMQGGRVHLSTLEERDGVYRMHILLDPLSKEGARHALLSHAISVLRGSSKTYVKVHKEMRTRLYQESKLRDTQPIGK